MSDEPVTLHLIPHRVRHLDAADLELDLPDVEPEPPQPPTDGPEPLDADDPVLIRAEDLLKDYGGLIFVGPPGTSKSWTAARLAVTLAGDMARVRFTQFHPAYQYEDFVEGYVPDGGGFDLKPKHLRALCIEASKPHNKDHRYVLVIDELSRGEPGRIFGEALTYVERSKRGLTVSLASGNDLTIPPNLIFLATMNPLDRGVDEVDAAFERRFAKYPMDPDEITLTSFLVKAGMSDSLRERVVTFFRLVNRRSQTNPFAALGHTYFYGVSDEVGLRRVWEHQLRFLFDKAFRGDPDGKAEVERWWNDVFPPDLPPDASEDEETEPEADAGGGAGDSADA